MDIINISGYDIHGLLRYFSVISEGTKNETIPPIIIPIANHFHVSFTKSNNPYEKIFFVLSVILCLWGIFSSQTVQDNELAIFFDSFFSYKIWSNPPKIPEKKEAIGLIIAKSGPNKE